MVEIIFYIKRYFSWLFQSQKEMDVSYLILFSIFYSLLQVFSERISPIWYIDIIFIIIKVLVGITILRISHGYLVKLLGKLNKPVRFRYFILVIFVSSFIDTFIK